MKKYEDIVKECNYFLDDTGYRDLPEIAKIQINTYMKGIIDGLKISRNSENRYKKVKTC